MKPFLYTGPGATREAFEKLLEGCLGALDREHYPDSLIESMTAVLKAPGALRGVPLLLALTGSGQSALAGSALVAVESLFRAFLLLADLGQGEAESGPESLGRRLAERFSPALLLLTADTLFTWPFELVSGQRDSGGRLLALSLAEGFGVRGGLGGLDAVSGGLASLAGLDPLAGLAGAWRGASAPRSALYGLAGKWVYLNELDSWFGHPVCLAETIRELEGKLEAEAAEGAGEAGRLSELLLFLGD